MRKTDKSLNFNFKYSFAQMKELAELPEIFLHANYFYDSKI